MVTQTRTNQQAASRAPAWLAVVSWAVMLAVSMLPNALLHELAGASPEWLRWAKIGLLAAAAGLTFMWSGVRPLRSFFIVLLAIFAAEEIAARLGATAAWQAWFGSGGPFVNSMLGVQLLRLLVALAMIGVLLGLGLRRAQFFLVRGQLDAPTAPVRWLGYTRPMPWTRFGAQWSVFIALGLLVFLVLGGRPSVPALLQTAPLLPFILVLAAMNAFSEEMTYRSTLLAGLEPAVGSRHALWTAALFFGIGHYFGVPYGPLGVIMATFLGWMAGKAMLETRGFFWAWVIHFVQDVLIFTFMAAGSITPGGS